MDRFVLEVPADPANLKFMRNLAAAAAARAGSGLDPIDDLELAVDEAATFLLRGAPDGARLRLDIGFSPGRFQATLALDGPITTWPPDGLGRTLGMQILTALTDEVQFGADPHPSIRFTKRVRNDL